MRKLILPLLVMCLALPNLAHAVKTLKTSNVRSYTAGGVSIALSDPAGSIYRPGEPVQFSYQTGEDAYVIIFDIDTEGYVHLIHPPDGRLSERSAADQRYTIPDPREASSLIVEGETGIEFVFALAVPDREYLDENELYFLADNRRFQIDGDPFLAANMIAGELIRGISQRDDVSLAYTYFNINNYVTHPRYICAECHDRPAGPYQERCTQYEFAANFRGETSNLNYPLDRAYEISDIGYAEEDVYDDDEDITRVEVVFYPYDSYVGYQRPWWIHNIYYDPWWYYDPFWYDPWYSCAVYYPYHPWHHDRYGFWFSFGWNWGWHQGYWAGYNHPFYSHPHHWYPEDRWQRHRPGGYRYKGPSLANTLQVASRRDPDLRISSLKYKGGAKDRINRGVGDKDAGFRAKDGSVKSHFKPPSATMGGKSRIKTPAVKRDKPHINKGQDSRLKDRNLKKPADRTFTKPPTKSKQPQKPDSKFRSTPDRKPTKSVDRSKSESKSPSNSQKSRSYKPNTRKSSEKKSGDVKSRSSSNNSSTFKRSAPAQSNSSSSTNRSSYKAPSRSSSPQSSPSRSNSSSGSSKSRGSSSKGGKGKG